MAGLPVVNGLYITFFAIVTYIFFGSSRHASPGVYGVISLMVATCIETNKGILYPSSTPSPNSTIDTSGFVSTDVGEAKIIIAATLCFYSGIFMVIVSGKKVYF
jgi:MFS superfamily sulfate permease-like transporter